MKQASLLMRSIKAWKRSSTKPAAEIGQAPKRTVTNSAKNIPSSRQVSRGDSANVLWLMSLPARIQPIAEL